MGRYAIGLLKELVKPAYILKSAFKTDVQYRLAATGQQVGGIIDAQLVDEIRGGDSIVLFHATRKMLAAFAAQLQHACGTGGKIYWLAHLFTQLLQPGRNGGFLAAGAVDKVICEYLH